jgi:hypothetical protein
MLLHSCCCIFNYVMFGFCSTQKGVQNLLKMNLQNCFIKEKGNHLFFSLFSLDLARWPNQPPPFSLPQAQEGAAPPFPQPGQVARTPLFLGRPADQAAGQRALPPPSADGRSQPSPAADALGPHPPSLPCGAAASAVSYLPPGWPGAFHFLTPPEIELISPFPSRFTHPAVL